MLVHIKDALFILAFGFPALAFASLFMRIMSVNRTRLRYVLKTCQISFICATILNNVFFFGLSAYLAVDPLDKSLSCIAAVVMTIFWLRELHDVIHDSDDDWFNDQWKKSKRWVKNLRARRHLKPSFASA
jgi:hypothetical protein